MATNSLIRKLKQRRPHKPRSPAIIKCPQQSAIVKKSFITTPRKPNSAKRKVAKVVFRRTRRIVDIYLEGIDFNKLNPHSIVLVRGKGPRDTPGVNYHAIRGKGDFPPLLLRKKGRSKYGTKRLVTKVKEVRHYPFVIPQEKIWHQRYLMYGYSNYGRQSRRI